MAPKKISAAILPESQTAQAAIIPETQTAQAAVRRAQSTALKGAPAERPQINIPNAEEWAETLLQRATGTHEISEENPPLFEASFPTSNEVARKHGPPENTIMPPCGWKNDHSISIHTSCLDATN